MFWIDCRLPFFHTPIHFCTPLPTSLQFFARSQVLDSLFHLLRKRKFKRLLHRLLFSAKRICSQNTKDEKANRRVLVCYWMSRMQKMTDSYATTLCAMLPIGS